MKAPKQFNWYSGLARFLVRKGRPPGTRKWNTIWVQLAGIAVQRVFPDAHQKDIPRLIKKYFPEVACLGSYIPTDETLGRRLRMKRRSFDSADHEEIITRLTVICRRRAFPPEVGN
jgi:hypothetical protein